MSPIVRPRRTLLGGIRSPVAVTLPNLHGCDNQLMNNENEELLTQHDEKLVRMMSQAHASSILQVEALKLRFAHNEKLVALCAGTLALSFTASTAFRGAHVAESSTLAYLLRSWQLLMVAIALALIANWLDVNGISNFANSMFRKQVNVHFSLLYPSLSKLDSAYANKERELSGRQMEKQAREEKVSNVLIRLSGLVGVFAQIAAFGAFVALYLCAKAALSN